MDFTITIIKALYEAGKENIALGIMLIIMTITACIEIYNKLKT